MTTKLKQYSVVQLAGAAKVTAEIVRYYTKLGLLTPDRNLENNYRLYNQSDLIKLKFIRRAKILGYTLGEIRQLIDASMNKKSPCPIAREIIHKRIVQNRRDLDDAIKLQKRMELAMKKWNEMPDALPVGNSICHLIESVT